MLDLAKLQRKRSDDFKAFFAAAMEVKKSGPDSLTKILPAELSSQVVGSVMTLAMKIGTLSGDKGQSPNPMNMTPDQLESFGKALKDESVKLGKAIADFEKSLLSKKGKK